MINEELVNLGIKPLSGTAEKLMVLLHGVGSDGSDLLSLVPFIDKELKEFYFYSPNAIEKFDMAPYGYQWFSLANRTASTIFALAEKNAPKILKLIQDKQNELGLSNKDTVLLGFSQGAMIGSYLTFIQEEPYAGFIGMSGRLIQPKKIINTQTPICLIHGVDDEVVDYKESEEFARICEENKIRCDLKLIKNLDHSIDGEGINFALNFIKTLK